MSTRICRPSRRTRHIAPSATKLMSQRAAQQTGCVSLGQGLPGFPPPAHVTETIARLVKCDPGINRYTLQNGLPELRQRISDYLLQEKEVPVNPKSELCITVGGMEALLATVLTVADPGDEVLLPSPTYASYFEQVQLAGATPVGVPLNEQWELDLERLAQSITPRSTAILICNPGNPTGNVYTDEQVRALCELAIVHGLVVIIDEAYDYIVYSGEKTLNPLGNAAYRKHVITIGSLSKKYCLTGWRIGWVAADVQWMEHISKVHDATTICAPTPSQYAALAALEGDQQWVEACCRELARRKTFCCQRLDRLSPDFSYIEPQGAFYVMARYHFTTAPSQQVADRLVDQAGIITVPGSSYGPGGEGHLRLSFGGEIKEIREAFDRLEQWLETNGHP